MVNLVAGCAVVPELIQDDMTAERIASEVCRLLEDAGARNIMCTGLAGVAKELASDRDPMETAADWVEKVVSKVRSGDRVHAE
jgi:lipid A disaccharide synthetase